jgi:quinoprotein glucose dehydrogenase
VVISGSNITDINNAQMVSHYTMPPGDVRGVDVRTGKQLWLWHSIPRPGEAGNETWLNDSWAYTGNVNVWGSMSGDEDLGLVYLPETTPSNDWYGARRPGNGLYAESIVALEAKTGKMKWYFQGVHHGIWDYDFPGRRCCRHQRQRPSHLVLAQPSKQAFSTCSIDQRQACGRSKSGRSRKATCPGNGTRRRSRSRSTRTENRLRTTCKASPTTT